MAHKYFLAAWVVLFVLLISAIAASAQTINFTASWYGPGFHGRPMANGKTFNMYTLVVAHRSLPIGTCLKLTNPENGRSVQVIVEDRGPYIDGRDLDVSYKVARILDFVDEGVTTLQGEPCTT